MQDMYPLPKMDDLVNGIGQLTINYLSSIDVKSGYHQILVATSSQDKTAFVYPGGFYKYLYMPFGLKNTPAVFQCFMDYTLRDVADKYVSTYIDDIIIKTKTFSNHKLKAKLVMQKLGEVGLMINLEKAKFLHSKVAYLGFELSAEGICLGTKKIKAVEQFPIPSDV